MPSVVHDVLRSPGQPLDLGVRASMESRFGHDFGRMRVHTDERAAQSAEAIQARAYTAGRDVVFARGLYAPQTMEGHRLLAHELTHVVQQESAGDSAGRIQRQAEPEQGLVDDVWGWSGDLAKSLAWALLAGGEERGRASIHLLHSMLGSGEPLTVPKSWIMDSPTWWKAYTEHLEKSVTNAATDAASRAREGETSGADHFSETIKDVGAKDPGVWCLMPQCEEADQFFASGAADFTVEGDYWWEVAEDGSHVEIELYNIVGRYHDLYDWHHEYDPSQYSRQERGWYTPFELIADWEEPDRNMRADILFSIPGLPIPVYDVSETSELLLGTELGME